MDIADQPDFKPNLYLVGFMGTGKSVLGKRLAEHLGYAFLDSDSEIEKHYGMTIREIFETNGEQKFRDLEREFIEKGHPNSGCVIACGGGLVCREGMPELVKNKGVCVSLFSYPDVILKRVSQNNKRPMLDSEDPKKRIEELLKKRTPFYMKSGVAIATDERLDETEAHILRIYKRKLRDLKSKVSKKK